MNGHRSRSHGGTWDRWAEHQNSNRQNTAVSKMQHHFWVTKQTVFRKFGKKEDECIVASDAELDAKLELFCSIQQSCMMLQNILEEYQKKSNSLAYEENSMGRFLKESAKLNEKTDAGKMMAVVGKTLATTGQQRLAFQDPLRGLQKKVESFRSHAIADTLHTIQEMEKTRTRYRAGLNWMKDVSKQLDPENHSLMDKYRKVQEHVKQSRADFERQKLDCLQKVDLLAAARCNMFSRELIQYENTLQIFSNKCVNMFDTISTSFPTNPQYKFTDVKELVEEEQPAKLENKDNKDNDDKPLVLEDLIGNIENHRAEVHNENKMGERKEDNEEKTSENSSHSKTNGLENLISDLENHREEKENKRGKDSETSTRDVGEGVLFADLLTDALPDNQLLPSQLLAQLSSDMSLSSKYPPTTTPALMQQQSLLTTGLTNNDQSKIPSKSLDQNPNKAWFDLFAELDPLSDPDKIDKNATAEDRNC